MVRKQVAALPQRTQQKVRTTASHIFTLHLQSNVRTTALRDWIEASEIMEGSIEGYDKNQTFGS